MWDKPNIKQQQGKTLDLLENLPGIYFDKAWQSNKLADATTPRQLQWPMDFGKDNNQEEGLHGDGEEILPISRSFNLAMAIFIEVVGWNQSPENTNNPPKFSL